MATLRADCATEQSSRIEKQTVVVRIFFYDQKDSLSSILSNVCGACFPRFPTGTRSCVWVKLPDTHKLY